MQQRSTTQPLKTQQPIPFNRDPENLLGGASCLRFAFVLALIGGLALWFLWKKKARRLDQKAAKAGDWLKTWMQGGDAKPIEILQSSRLTPHASVHVVRWRGSEYLLGCADKTMTVVAYYQGQACEGKEGQVLPSPEVNP